MEKQEFKPNEIIRKPLNENAFPKGSDEKNYYLVKVLLNIEIFLLPYTMISSV
jgi:hypothetical protein